MGAQALTLTHLTPAEVEARPRHQFGSQAVAIQGCTSGQDDKLLSVHDVHTFVRVVSLSTPSTLETCFGR